MVSRQSNRGITGFASVLPFMLLLSLSNVSTLSIDPSETSTPKVEVVTLAPIDEGNHVIGKDGR